DATTTSAAPSLVSRTVHSFTNSVKMSASVVSGRWSGGLVLSLLVVLLVAPSPAPAKSFDFLQIVSSLADNVITRLYREDEIELLGHYCTISRTPYFYKWELNFRATSRCPDWTTALGKEM
ncbi:hypothetical protein OTU49_010190, partial [Cherax quadricarinatus]